MTRTRLLALIVGAALVGTLAPSSLADEPPVGQTLNFDIPVRFIANAFAMGQAISGTSRVEFLITRWSDPSEGDALEAALIELGPGAVRQKLQELPEVGRVRIGDELSEPLQFAQIFHVQEDDSFMILLATDRDIEPFEAYYRTRTLDYDLALVELRIDADGNGSGTVAAGVRLGYNRDTNTMIIEDFDTQPVRLRAVRISQQ